MRDGHCKTAYSIGNWMSVLPPAACSSSASDNSSALATVAGSTILKLDPDAVVGIPGVDSSINIIDILAGNGLGLTFAMAASGFTSASVLNSGSNKERLFTSSM